MTTFVISDAGQNVTLSEDKLSFSFPGDEQVRVIVKSNATWTYAKDSNQVYYYEITLKKSDDAVGIGLVSSENPLRGIMPGWVQGSVGYHSDDGGAFFDGGQQRGYGPTYGVGDTSGLGLICSTGELFFTLNGRYLGPTTNLTEGDYTPAVGTNAPCEVTANFEGPFVFDMKSLTAPVKELITNVVAENPSVVLFVDGLEEEKAKAMIKELENVGNNWEGKPIKFFFAHAGPKTERIRKFVGAPSAPCLSIIDIKEEESKYFAPSDATITSESIRHFIEQYHKGELKSHIKSGPRPANDKNESHPTMTQVVANSFKEIVLDSGKDVLLDVYADWCGPCVNFAPTYALVADVLHGHSNIIIAKLDRDTNDVDRKYLPERGIPNIKFFPASDKEHSIKYEGNRTVNSVLTFLHENATEKFDLEAAQKRGAELQAEADKKANKNVKKIHTKEEYTGVFEKAEDKLIVVDFTAVWCGPCKAIAPVFADYSEKFPNVIFLKVDVDELQEVSKEANIECMPTFQFYKKGGKVDQLEGADKDGLLQMIQKHI